MTLRARAPISEFITTTDPVRMLTDINEFYFSDAPGSVDSKYRDHPLTTDDMKIFFSDLRVLGKNDYRKILKWRTKVSVLVLVLVLMLVLVLVCMCGNYD